MFSYDSSVKYELKTYLFVESIDRIDVFCTCQLIRLVFWTTAYNNKVERNKQIKFFFLTMLYYWSRAEHLRRHYLPYLYNVVGDRKTR